jgi:glycerol-1-phosphate dehydrogenase [NAD(P)+]
MTSWPRVSKLKASHFNLFWFPLASELLITDLPVENTSTRLVPLRLIGSQALLGLPDAVANHLPAQNLLLVCDENTWVAAGEEAYNLLASAHAVDVHRFGRRIVAKKEHAQTIAEKAVHADALIAVGSGTLNDITKYAAHSLGKPYAVVATAASMNGYSAANASLLNGQQKQSFAATPPRFVLADTNILAKAPKRLARAGLGDTLAQITVEPDMLLSHHIHGTPYPKELFRAMRRHERHLIDHAAQLREAEPAYLETLMHALLDGGDAMTAHGSSAVASQGEHMIAHTLEMLYGSEMYNVLHGEMVAIATLTMSRLQHKMMLGTQRLKPLVRDEAHFKLRFGALAPDLAVAYSQKLVSPENADAFNASNAQDWPAIKAAILEIMPPSNLVAQALVRCGQGTSPQEIGIAEDRYRIACTYAYLTRDRFTFLDLAEMNEKRVA